MSEISNSPVDAHRQALFLSGNISDFHLENLQKWCYILFDDVSSVEIHYSFKNEHNQICAGQVAFNIIFNNRPKLSGDKRRAAFKSLETWTKFLFWGDTKVIIARNGKVWL